MVVKWGVYTFTKGTHNKFWSVKYNNNKLTGDITYGRIGKSHIDHKYDSSEIIHKKEHEKVRKGYKFLGLFNTPDPTGVR